MTQYQSRSKRIWPEITHVSIKKGELVANKIRGKVLNSFIFSWFEGQPNLYARASTIQITEYIFFPWFWWLKEARRVGCLAHHFHQYINIKGSTPSLAKTTCQGKYKATSQLSYKVNEWLRLSWIRSMKHKSLARILPDYEKSLPSRHHLAVPLNYQNLSSMIM